MRPLYQVAIQCELEQREGSGVVRDKAVILQPLQALIFQVAPHNSVHSVFMQSCNQVQHGGQFLGYDGQVLYSTNSMMHVPILSSDSPPEVRKQLEDSIKLL